MFSIIKRIIAWCGDKKARLYWGFVFCFFEAVFVTLPVMGTAFILGIIIDGAKRNEPLDPLWALYALIFMILMVLGRALFSYLKARYQESIAYELTEQERIKIGDVLKRVSLGFFQSNRSGDLSAAVSTDLSYIELYSMHMIAIVVNAYILAAVMVITLAIFNAAIGLIVLAAILVSLVFLTILGKGSKKSAPTHRKVQDDMVSATLEYIRGISVVKAYGQAGAAIQSINKAFRDSRKINIGIELKYAPINSLHIFALDLGSVAIVAVSAYFTVQGTMPLNIFLMMAMFAFILFANLMRVSDSVHTLENIDVIMDKLDVVKSAAFIDADGKEHALTRFDIAFDTVDFAYEDTSRTIDYYGGKAMDMDYEQGEVRSAFDRPSHSHNAAYPPASGKGTSRNALENVSFTIPEGTTTAIVGPSGGGKSTVCSLLMRFYDVRRGSVRIGGVDVRELKCDSLLDHISTVFQNVYLLNDTVTNNIRFGKPGASMDEVILAAKQARCHEFIMQLPKGYDTLIGETGGTLSGGEKQRISIARALLKDAPIIILDEATASIDPENEHLVQDALASLTRDKTVVVIAHRLNTIESADQILVLDKGRIVERGRHEDLVERPGIYRHFVDIRQQAESWVMP